MDDALQNLENEHSQEAIRQRLALGFRHNYLKDFIYGAIDGAVTTFAIVSGVVGAQMSSKVIIILGMANLLADGFSMAVSNYLGTRAEDHLRTKMRKEEEAHIRTIPDGEREEIRQIFSSKGFKGRQLEKVVSVITSDPKRWVDTMIQEELGLSLEGPSPWKAACTTFVAFIAVGSVPLLAFLYEWFSGTSLGRPFLISALLTGAAFFFVGALKGRFVGHKWVLSGLETLAVGSFAALLAYYVGVFLQVLI